MSRRTVVSWCLYDFANSFYAVLPAVLWTVYYREQIVGNQTGRGDLWWGYAISGSMLIVGLSSPLMGAVADHAGVRKRLLAAYTFTSVAAVALYATVSPGMAVWGLIVTVISYVGFEGALVFYNAYLPEIAPPGRRGRVSGWGFGVGYAGSLLALILSLLLIRTFDPPLSFQLTWFAIAAAFLLFSLPALRFLPKDSPPRLGWREAARGGLHESLRTFREIRARPQPRRFLLAYFFYEDGVNTVIVSAAAFASITLGFATEQLIMLFALVQISALAGALAWARPTDRLGPKRVVAIMLAQWSLAVTAAYVVQTPMQFYVVAVLAGTGLGAIQAASRALMATMIPPGREGDYFGFYHLCGKSAAVIGPVLFGHVSEATGGNQRLAILSILILFVVGAVLLSRVHTASGVAVSQAPGPKPAM